MYLVIIDVRSQYSVKPTRGLKMNRLTERILVVRDSFAVRKVVFLFEIKLAGRSII